MAFSINKTFVSIGHGLAWFAKHVVSASKATAADIAKIAPMMPDIEAVTTMISLQAAGLEDSAFKLLGKYGEAAVATGNAVAAGGINVQLEQDAHDKILAFYNSVKDQIASGVRVPVPPQPAAPAK